MGEDWWADVLADPRARKRNGAPTRPVWRNSYRLSDGLRPVIFVACSKCDWRAAFNRDELFAFHGATCAMPSLLNESTRPGGQAGESVGSPASIAWSRSVGCSRRTANRTK